jgi:hypothetical protein
MKILIATLMLFSISLYAKDADESLQQLLKGSQSFSCHVGKFKVVKVKSTGAFIKFSLEGSGTLINANGAMNDIGANPNIEYMVPSSDKYIAEGKYISVNCEKALSAGGSPFPVEFYVEATK